MDRKPLAVLAVALAVLAVAALAVLAGVAPLDGGDEGDTDFPTDTGTSYGPAAGGDGDGDGDGSGGSGDGGDGGDGGQSSDGDVEETGQATTTPPPPFRMVIESVEPCGQTCRDVTGRLENNQDREATGVTVYTRIHAGDDTDGDVVWEGSQDVGRLGPGEAHQDTQRVELGMMEAAKVQNNGGRITILTVVETDRQTVSFVDHRDVS